MKSPPDVLTLAAYQELADFRYQIRRFLHFSEQAALDEGVEPRQHQALLAIKAVPALPGCTVRTIAEQIFLEHQSAVGLVDRLEQRGLVSRVAGVADRRQVILVLTKKGEHILTRLSLTHHAELEERAPELIRALQAIVRRNSSRECR